MPLSRPRIPFGLLTSVVILLILGRIAGPLIRANFTEKERAANVLLEALPFILTFVAIILTFITLISLVASVLNDNIARRTHQIIERIIMLGIIGGVIGMFQPWWFSVYKYSFMFLFISTLAFILWSHIRPKRELRQNR
jgi:magnesium-transporting ATPase (P-type)